MRVRGFIAIMASAAALAATTAHSFCREIKPEAPAAEAVALGLPVPYAEATYRAYKGVATAAKIDIPLHICRIPEPNAIVIDSGGKRTILITTALIDLARGDADELAAVFGHEFGHLLHRHVARKREQAMRTLETAKRQAGGLVRGGVAVNDAIDAAKDLFKDRVTDFSRAAEREADDQGFALTQVAGFDPSGARRFFERMEKLQGAEQKGWFATHPGWKERVAYSTTLETNESFRRLAELHRKTRRSCAASWASGSAPCRAAARPPTTGAGCSRNPTSLPPWSPPRWRTPC
jgi:Zn-dependent protease with chaperone function